MDMMMLAQAIVLLKEKNIKSNYMRFSPKYLWITDKKSNKIKLKQNRVQKQVNNRIEEMRAQGKPPRIIILKSRQMGVTTDVEGRMIYKTTTKPNKNGLVVAHDDTAVKAIFKKSKYFHDNLEESVKPLKRASNAKELIFDTPTHYKGNQDGLNSSLVVQIAGSSGMGRGDTPHFVHLSEFAYWTGKDENSPSKQLTGVMNAVPDELDTWVIIESTANGMNDFKKEWDKAVKGDSAFSPLFLAWYDHEEYIKEVPNPERFKLEMSKYELYLYDDLMLPLERVAWWRWALKNKCNGDINLMRQENPSTPEEAFIFSGTPVFDNEKIMKRITELEKLEKPYKEGYFAFEWNNPEYHDKIIDRTIRFIESSNQPWFRIYEDRKSRYPYVIAGDTKGEGKDEYTAQVMDNTNSFRVATCQIQLNNSKPFAWQMYCAGRYFNNALVGIEMNWNTGPLEELERLGYDDQYYREKSEGFNGQIIKDKLGWRTDGITRPRMIDKEVFVVNQYLYLIRDIPTLRQMLTFVKDKNNRPDAMSGEHDDLLIADCILNEISDQQDKIPSESITNKTINDVFFGQKKKVKQEEYY